MKYSELTKSQKICIDEFVKYKPELASAKSITLKEVGAIWDVLYARRESGGAVFGFPMWLLRGPKVSRGVYVFPAPSPEAEDTYDQTDDPAKIELLEDCKKYGISLSK